MIDKITKFWRCNFGFSESQSIASWYLMVFSIVLILSSYFLKSSFKVTDEESEKAYHCFLMQRHKTLDLNRITISKLCVSFPSIHKGLLRRVIRYRDLLGGYNNIKQLKEVYGMKDGYYSKMEFVLFVTLDSINKIHVNTCDYSNLVRHPYISKQLAIRILKSRKTKKFSHLDELVDRKIMSRPDYERLKRYLLI